MKQIIGKKIGMVSLFDKNGQMIAGTVILCEPNVVVEKKNKSINVGYCPTIEKKINKAKSGIFLKNNLQPHKYIKNLKTDNDYELGSKVDINIFEIGD
jgi:large subunit ribosomal protein L3